MTIDTLFAIPIKLEDLKVGDRFGGRTLIIDRELTSMKTIEWQRRTGTERQYSVRVFMYDLEVNPNGFVRIKNNSHYEIHPQDSQYQDYADKLNRIGITPTE